MFFITGEGQKRCAKLYVTMKNIFRIGLFIVGGLLTVYAASFLADRPSARSLEVVSYPDESNGHTYTADLTVENPWPAPIFVVPPSSTCRDEQARPLEVAPFTRGVVRTTFLKAAVVRDRNVRLKVPFNVMGTFSEMVFQAPIEASSPEPGGAA